jgi:acyl-CoA reductase-like NAD-dependent aldehyde dehydrogenase
MTTQIRQFIAGSWRDGGGSSVESVNPARPTEVVAQGPAARADDVDTAVGAAAKAADGWRRMPMHERAGVLRRAGILLEERAEQYGLELTREEGKTLAEGVGEVRRAAEILRYNAGLADVESGQVFESPRAGERIIVVHKPVGVVAVITPWNFPIAIPAWKIAPALIHGNAVVWKPASLVPLMALRLAEVLEEGGLPPGVLSLLIGPGAIGASLAGHPDVNALTFTGSTEVGTSLLQLCAPLRRPVQAEMGGKNAAVVFADADLDLAAHQVVLGAMRSTGQKCTATSRVVVDEQVADDFLDRVSAQVRAIVVGNGEDPEVTMGPAASSQARSEIDEATTRAIDGGAELVVSTSLPDDDGYYVRGSVLRLRDREHSIWRDEVFGPVLAVTTSRNDAEAIALANDSAFGLSAAVFTTDLQRALRAIDELDVGVLHLNSESAGADPHVPFGGAKDSGIGPKEQGQASREFFTTTTTAYVR